MSEEQKPTFGEKLQSMHADLASIVDRMNRDRSVEHAQAAQTALIAVDALWSSIEDMGFNDTEWDWEPTP